MDAHLVGYGSSSEDEGKAKKRDVQTKLPGKERNFRKRSMTPENSSTEESVKQTSRTQDFEGSTNIPEQTERCDKSKMNESLSEEKEPVSKSQSPHAERSPDRKKNHDGGKKSRSRSRSSSSSSDKEQRSAVDQYGRHVRRQHSGRTKDEDPSSKDKRRYSREKKRSRSRSRSRDRDRGFGRRDSYRRRNDDRYKPRGRGGRRWSRDSKRERSRERSQERNKERNRNRSRERSTSRDRSPKRRVRRGGGAQVYLGGLERKPTVPAKKEVLISSEEVEKKLAARAESLKQEAQATATTLNLPSFFNPSVVNPQLYAKQQEKRKLLWSGKKTEEVPSNSTMWAGTRFTGDQGGEMKAKFRRLMGIKGADGSAEPTEGDVTSKGEKILTDLEEEFERSRAFQLSRGAGGKSGVGLGYASANYNV